jgi:hypothetical protein
MGNRGDVVILKQAKELQRAAHVYQVLESRLIPHDRKVRRDHQIELARLYGRDHVILPFPQGFDVSVLTMQQEHERRIPRDAQEAPLSAQVVPMYYFVLHDVAANSVCRVLEQGA